MKSLENSSKAMEAEIIHECIVEREQATTEGIQGEGKSRGCIERGATLRFLKEKVRNISGAGAPRVRRQRY